MKETGVGIHEPLFFIGVVENNVDDRLEGRVQVRAFGVHGTNKQVPTEDLPWATLIHGSYDANSPVPPSNSFVFGFFVDGRDAQQPMILGLIPSQMTEVNNPEITGWGYIPPNDARILAKGSNPSDLGEPSNSKLGRGENIEETYVFQQEMMRTKEMEIADPDPDAAEADDSREYFAEPGPAYNSQYPFNRVIETASHSIEMDDTPGAERITIYHGSGSYVAMDARGNTTHKSVMDKFDINDRNRYVHVKGRSIVTVEGDSQVLVKGNKIEEVTGDLIQHVRGNHLLSVGGQSTFNVSDEIQMRSAKIRIESNQEGINIKAAKDLKINSKTMYIDSEGDLNIKAEHPKIGGGEQISIRADLVAIDDFVHMAMNESDAPDVLAASAVDAPEPVGKAVSTTRNESYDGGMVGSSGYSSADEPENYDEADVQENADAAAAAVNESGVQDAPPRSSSSGEDITNIVETGPGYNIVKLADGRTVKQEGTRAWRNNNPGNIMYGDFAKSQGAIGTDGRFAIFPDYETGRGAKEKLLFGTNSYKNLTLSGAINRYAPSFENDTSAYISNVARSSGVSYNTRMRDIPVSVRPKILDAFERQEGFRKGRVIDL